MIKSFKAVVSIDGDGHFNVFVKHFEQRGMMEIKELNQTINE